jgi:glyceraldehyde 3-phosphate dehydrogenase
MPIRVAINGFGRIGRAFLRCAEESQDIEVVAINDLTEIDNLVYLLRYDSVYGKPPFDVGTRKDGWRTLLTVGGRDVPVYMEKDPSVLPWKDLDVDVVVEATGVFREYEKAKIHLDAGAKRVVITAPAKGDPATAKVTGATVLMGINSDVLKTCDISSNGSCTTNAAAPMIEILHESIGVEKAMLNTVHAYTATQSLVDLPDKKDWRRGRAAAQNIIPSTTGAATAVTKVVTDLKDKFDGIAMRVPVIAGSIVDVTFIAKRTTSVEEVNGMLRLASEDERWSKVFTTSNEALVSSDVLGSKYASIADLAMTRVVDGTLVKVCAWYDNEMGYTYSLLEHVRQTGEYVKTARKGA